MFRIIPHNSTLEQITDKFIIYLLSIYFERLLMNGIAVAVLQYEKVNKTHKTPGMG